MVSVERFKTILNKYSHTKLKQEVKKYNDSFDNKIKLTQRKAELIDNMAMYMDKFMHLVPEGEGIIKEKADKKEALKVARAEKKVQDKILQEEKKKEMMQNLAIRKYNQLNDLYKQHKDNPTNKTIRNELARMYRNASVSSKAYVNSKAPKLTEFLKKLVKMVDEEVGTKASHRAETKALIKEMKKK
jgi:hypothetical protein